MSGRASPLFGGGCLHKRGPYVEVFLIIFGLSFFFFFSLTPIAHPSPISSDIFPANQPGFSVSSMTDDPISITKNDEFEKLGFEGNGTETNPYIIENLSIHVMFDGIGISIISTSVFFVIQNCELFSYDSKSGTGVYLEKVDNGAVVNCSFDTLAVGVSVLKSEDCDFINNSLSGLGKGFYLTQSIRITVQDNTLANSGYGLYLNKIDFSDLVGNDLDQCNYAILIESCNGIHSLSNHIVGSFFGVYFHNTVRSLAFNSVIQFSQYGIYYAYSQECNISSSELSKNRYGISFLEVDKGTILNNLVKSNNDFGVHIKNSRNINILSNTIFENKGTGLYLLGVSGAVIHENEIGYNLGINAADYIGAAAVGLVNNWDRNAWSDYKGTPSYAISGDRGSRDNEPHYIVFLSSPSDMNLEAPASGFINWSASAFRPSYFSIKMNGVTIEEDIWDGNNLSAAFLNLDPGTYTFVLSVTTASGRTASDTVILSTRDTTPPDWLQIPEDQIIECGNPLIYQLYAIDYYGISRWWVNSSLFNIDSGLLQNISILEYGIIHVEVRAYDPSENYVSHVIQISVNDSISPSVDSPADILFIVGELGFSITWSVYDCNPSAYEIFKNGVSIQFGDWTPDMLTIQYSLNDLPAGSYVFTIILTDAAGNSVSDDVHVTVEMLPTTEPPTTTTGTATSSTPPTTTSPSSSTPTDTVMNGPDMLTLSLLGIGTGVVVVVVILFMKKR